MGTVITNLKARFGVDSAGFANGLKKAEGSLSDLDRKVGKSIMELQNMLTPVALLAGAGGGLALLRSSIDAIEGPSDRMEAAISGGKEALFEMQRALVSLDFNGFIDNLAEGYARGKKFAEMLDELADKTAYSDYIVVGLQQEADALREISKNKTLEISVRAKAAEDIKAIELKIFERRKELLAETYDIEKLSWEGRNKMSITEGVKLFETISKITKSGYNEVTAETVNKIKELYDNSVEASIIGGSSIVRATKDAATLVKANLAGFGNYDFIKNIPKEDLTFLVDSLAMFTQASRSGEAGIWEKLFETINKNAREVNSAQKEYNSAVAETTKLLAQEEKAQANVTTAVDAQTDAAREALLLETMKAKQIAFSLADLTQFQPPDFGLVVSSLEAPKQAIQQVFADVSSAVTSAFTNMAEGIGGFLGALASGNAGAGDFVNVIKAIFADLAITVGGIIIAAAAAKMQLDIALTTFGAAGVAMAAGIALVAIGSAVKGSMKSAVGAGGSSSFSSAGSGFANAPTYSQIKEQSIKLEINGKLTADGPSLAYVFNQESFRKKSVT
jgi:hypothetical protein